ncbi:hypothetical protein C0Q70_18311 [Pomacea canaliculata]|uniref:LRAT domain-containing protein n=1 Tax=Pomacea canaliculata TaxID=400727 RepID=A0A2T7NMU0_POMCA|nr:HRAS-like suppressor 3 [Pomacea canaliculata]XP_025112859.1 HRAS-like suppressor 3 [Pomacea canaliculata]XP_025112860.1 HRAS-like suppressor 3 [Pomacea canaliculata]XP_025112861.1 HRAS-like suppressor 3 [Pomacea canaliculata]PVD22497.1 hypothetical protein C0Q70_18311 [Pomacea canaliculata]
MASREVTRHNREVLASLDVGDLVEFPRGNYSHWAVYLGGKDVIHLAGDDNDGLNAQLNPTYLTSFSGQCFNKAIVRIDSFYHVAGTDKAQRSNILDEKKQPLPRRQIVQRALSKLGEEGYNILMKNCEHFATWCRYGEASSDQVEFWVDKATQKCNVM